MPRIPRLVLTLQLLAGGVASAQSSWTASAPGDWLDPANWSAGVPNAVGAEAVIIGEPEGGPVDTLGTFTAASPITLGSLTVEMGFAGPSVFFNMPQLIFDNGGGADVFVSTDASLACEIFSDVLLMGDLISNWRAGNGRISGSISGDYGITHDPDFESNFELAGANAYTGETRILNGRLRIKQPAALGSPAAGTFVTGPTSSLIVDFEGTGALELVTLESGGRIWLRNVTITSDIVIDASGGITPWFDNSRAAISGVISGDTLVKSSAQSMLGNDPTAEAALFLSGESNTYTGGTVINAGLLVIAADGSLGAPGTPITFENPIGFSEGPPPSARALTPRSIAPSPSSTTAGSAPLRTPPPPTPSPSPKSARNRSPSTHRAAPAAPPSPTGPAPSSSPRATTTPAAPPSVSARWSSTTSSAPPPAPAPSSSGKPLPSPEEGSSPDLST
jgi:autotransporter-associated beta strand protein